MEFNLTNNAKLAEISYCSPENIALKGQFT